MITLEGTPFVLASLVLANSKFTQLAIPKLALTQWAIRKLTLFN